MTSALHRRPSSPTRLALVSIAAWPACGMGASAAPVRDFWQFEAIEPLAGAATTWASDLNDTCQVAACPLSFDSRVARPILWSSSGVTDLGAGAWIHAVNNERVAIGARNGRPAVYSDGQWTELSPPASAATTAVRASPSKMPTRGWRCARAGTA